MKNAVLIGAGQYGRGVIGMLLEQSGYHVLLADINEAVIQDVNTRGEYTVCRITDESHSVTVKNISAIHSLDPALPQKLAEADVICTCSGLTALSKVAPTIAKSIELRMAAGFGGTVNVLACENALGGSTILKGYVLTHLDEAGKAYLEEHIGFPDCAIDGIIPPVKNALPADVTAEEYYEWYEVICQFCMPKPLEVTIRGGCLGKEHLVNGVTCLFLPCDGSNGAVTAATDFCHFLSSYGKKVAAFSPYVESGEILWALTESITAQIDLLSLCINDWDNDNVVIPFINSNLVVLVTDGSKSSNEKVEKVLVDLPQITGESRESVYSKTVLLYNNFDPKTGVLIRNDELIKVGGLDVPRNSKAAFEKLVTLLNV